MCQFWAGLCRLNRRMCREGTLARVNSLRQSRRWPKLGSRLLAAVATIACLWPMLARLPKVSVVACFDAAHPLYALVPAEFGELHCLSAPAPVVRWTLMIGATLLVQALVLPLLVTVGAFVARGLRRFALSAKRRLALALTELSELVVPQQRLVPVRVHARGDDILWSRANPRRGPPSCLS